MYIYLDFFEGDYFAELPLRDFLISQFRFRYLEASELVGELRQRITKTLQIAEHERDFVCAALDRHGVLYRLQGQPAAAPAEPLAPTAKTTSAPIVQTAAPAEKVAPAIAPEPVEYVLNAPKGGAKMNDKIGFIKLLRETNRDPIVGDTESLKESKDKADALCEGAQKIRHLVKNLQRLPDLLAELKKLGISYHRIDEAPPTATINNFAPPLDTTPTAIQIAPLSSAAVKALSNEKLEFVKNIKMATGSGLKDSKDFADMVLMYPERSHHLPFGNDEQSVKILLAFLAKCGVKLQGQADTPATAPSSQFEVFLISEDGWNHSTGAVSGQKLNMIKWLRTMSLDPETQETKVGLAEAKAQVDALIEKKTPIRVEIRNKAQRDEFLSFVASLHLKYSRQ